ncbi:B12-binding domain-containing radical SAM protein [bacterium]|nr:B12-binding domain-containing radical SAM protein [bacterium]
MKTVLVRPSASRYFYTCIPPLGFGYLSTTLKRAGHSVLWADIGHEGYTKEKFFADLHRDPPGLLGFQIYSRTLPGARDLIEETRKHVPDTTAFVAGGWHPTLEPEQTLDFLPGVDFVLMGEADESMPRLANALEGRTGAVLDTIPGLAWREGGKVRKNEATLPPDLDALGHVDWEGMRPWTYKAENLGGFTKYAPAALMLASRGCPYICEFCSVPEVNGHRVRRHGIEHLLEDVELLHKKYGFREIRFMDDNFPTQKSYVLEFCDALRRKNFDIAISFPAGIHLRLVDGEVLDALKSVGLYSFSCGIESGNERVLKMIRKNITKDVVREKIKLVQSKGLQTTAFFILGYPTETRAEIEDTIRFARELDLTGAHFNVFTPFPGTKITRRLADWGLLREHPWEHIHLENVNYSYCKVSPRTLKYLRLKAIVTFWFRPRAFMRNLKRLRSFGQAKFLMEKLWEYAT